jgi:hypothetical protein
MGIAAGAIRETFVRHRPIQYPRDRSVRAGKPQHTLRSLTKVHLSNWGNSPNRCHSALLCRSDNPKYVINGETTVAEEIEVELAAIRTLVEALEPLKLEVRTRVIDHAFKVLGIDSPQVASFSPIATSPLLGQPALQVAPLPGAPIGGPTDILSFKEQKRPTTGTQMVVVVAFYLSHIATERQDFITADDIQKYFIQGKYPIPGSKSQALVDAKNAGYLDFAERGKYRLNSVGYNLVAHKMPKDGSEPNKTRRKVAKKRATKKGKK